MSTNSDFMAFAHDEASITTLRDWADRQGYPMDAVRNGGAELFSTTIESESTPKLVFIDFDNQENPIQTAARLVSLCGPKSKIIGIGLENDVSLYRSMISTGIHDYLVKPLTIDNLTQAMITATQGSDEKKQRKETKNIIFIGVRGGCGASTLATNVAWTIAHEKNIKTVLLDLDLQFGTSALSLDLEPGHGLRDVVSSPQRVDNLMIKGATINESEKFSVLSAEESIEEPVIIDPYAVTALIKELRITHQAVLIDLPRQLISTQKRILATAHEIILITEMSLVGIRDTLRIRNMLKTLGSSARITQIATRVEQNMGTVDEVTFTKSTNAKLHFLIPNDVKSLAAASNAGKTLNNIAPHAPITKIIRDLTSHVLGEENKKGNVGKKSFNLFGFLNSKEDVKK